MINNKTRHVHFRLHLQSDGGWSNKISGIYENGIKKVENIKITQACN